MAVQLAYHGTKSPISQIQSQGFRTGNLRSIAPGQVFMSNNPAFSAGYGNTIKMAAPKSTFSLPSKNLATGAWGKELITNPKAATKMMNLANYAEGLVGSPTAKRFLGGQTISGLGKKAVNTLAPKLLGGLGFLFDATPANADEINMTAEDFQNLALQNQTQPIDPTGKNLFTEYYEDDPYAGIAGQTAFNPAMKKIYDMYKIYNLAKKAKKYGPKVKKWITKKTPKITTAKGPPRITQIKKHKAPGGGGYGPHTKTKPKYKPPQQTGGGGGVHSGMKSVKTSAPKKSKSYQQASYARRGKADGGLINFFKNGGFLG